MNKRIKRIWLSQLRSGKIRQVKGALCKYVKLEDEYGFCCLGVLCNIYAHENNVKWDKQSDNGIDCYCSFRNYAGVLPKIVSEWSYVSPSQERLLAEMNDRGESFEDIADYIEKNL
jgi:hypothetical protein